MPKKWHCSLEEICELENVKWAYREARSSNSNKQDPWLLYYEDENHLKQLCDDILHERYIVKPADVYYISEPNNGKVRKIEAPCFETKIVEHMILGVIRKYIINYLHPNTCASIPDRGINKARKIIRKWARLPKKQKKYFVKGDFKHFFPSVFKIIAMIEYRRHISDRRVLRLIWNLLPHEQGLPLGNVLVQYTANILLTPFDYECTKWSTKYVRYMDDFVILFSSKRKAQKFVAHITEWVKDNLRLEIKMKEKSGIQIWKWKEAAIDLAGYRIDFNGNIRIRHRTYIKIRRLLKLDFFSVHQARSFLSLTGWVKYSSCRKLYEAMMEHNRQARKIVSIWSIKHNENNQGRSRADTSLKAG